MANKLSYNDLLKYLEIVLDMEKNVYIEYQAWNQLNNQANSLGIAKNYKAPVKAWSESLSSVIFRGLIVGIGYGIAAFFIIGFCSCTVAVFAKPKDYRIFDLVGIIVSIIVFLLTVIIKVTKNIGEKKYNQNTYNNELSTYNQNVANDKARVGRELQQKQYLQSQCSILSVMWQNSKSKLEKMYAYDILADKYRNIAAVASIYEYLRNGRTRSLEINGNDRGAYNIFEEEIRLNKIITNTEIIIQKLDMIIENQRELANVMRDATNSINDLVLVTITKAKLLQSGMNQLNASAELINYQQQQTNNELRYMNMMNTFHFYS